MSWLKGENYGVCDEEKEKARKMFVCDERLKNRDRVCKGERKTKIICEKERERTRKSVSSLC